MFNKISLFSKMNIIKMLNRFYKKIYLRKTSNINLPFLFHNLLNLNLLKKYGYPLPKGVVLRNNFKTSYIPSIGNSVGRTGIEPVLKRFRGVCITTLPTAQFN